MKRKVILLTVLFVGVLLLGAMPVNAQSNVTVTVCVSDSNSTNVSSASTIY